MFFNFKKLFFLNFFLVSILYSAAESDFKEKRGAPIWTSQEGLEVYALTGEQARQYFEDIAGLRLSMLCDYPYLYRGTFEYEKEYLEQYFASSNSVIYLAFHDEKVVGFSNLVPLLDADLEIQFAFLDQGIDISKHVYLGEGILAPEYRHQKGLLAYLNSVQEQYAKEKEYDTLVFMSVIRPDDHPLKPEGYLSYEALFEHFGYVRNDEVVVEIAWLQFDTSLFTDNRLSVWEKKI